VIGRKRLMIPADRRCHDYSVLNEEGKTSTAVAVIWRGTQRVESNFFPDVNHEGEIELLAELPKGAKLEED
jgi:hypothetical protein